MVAVRVLLRLCCVLCLLCVNYLFSCGVCVFSFVRVCVCMFICVFMCVWLGVCFVVLFCVCECVCVCVCAWACACCVC